MLFSKSWPGIPTISPRWSQKSRPEAALNKAGGANSVDVAPIFGLQQVGQQGEEGQEQHDPDADRFALQACRFAGVGQEGADVASDRVVLLGSRGAFLAIGDRETGDALALVFAL